MIDEIGRVRQELGWPIVMTPFSQIVLTQAVMNVAHKQRYAVIPDEVIRYAFGKFGRPNIPIAPEVMDRIDSLPRARELRNEPCIRRCPNCVKELDRTSAMRSFCFEPRCRRTRLTR